MDFNAWIYIAAGIELILLVLSCVCANTIKKNFGDEGGKELKKWHYSFTDTIYSFFITIISLFPLLGMLGTVIALIDIGSVFATDTAGSDMGSIKSAFFLALDSTELGIICSIIFKLLNTFFQRSIEDQIAKAKEYCDTKVIKNEQK